MWEPIFSEKLAAESHCALFITTGPENPWLLHTYAQNAPHPCASVLGQEVFESGFIPSDTDYRIFRDVGNIPGRPVSYL